MSITNIIQVVLLVGVAILLFPLVKNFGVNGFNRLKERFNKKKDVEVVPDTTPGPLPRPTLTKVDLAHIITEWEKFTNLLIENDMPKCAEDMKTLVNKITKEYRSDLNSEDNEEESSNAIDTLVSDETKPVEV